LTLEPGRQLVGIGARRLHQQAGSQRESTSRKSRQTPAPGRRAGPPCSRCPR
jgi:hypothetical protein